MSVSLNQTVTQLQQLLQAVNQQLTKDKEQHQVAGEGASVTVCLWSHTPFVCTCGAFAVETRSLPVRGLPWSLSGPPHDGFSFLGDRFPSCTSFGFVACRGKRNLLS